jgi:TM2 domain-containing membrane protein YozV/ribosomal protein L40E
MGETSKLPTMTRFCSSCGANVPDTAKFCNECGARLPDAATSQNPPPAQDTGSKSAFLALAGSTFVPGLGQVYEGNILRGYLVFLGTFFGFFLLIIPGIIIWLYGIYDAYSTAEKMNAGTVPFQPAPVLHMVLFVIVAIVIAVVTVIALMYLFLSVVSQTGGLSFAGNDADVTNLLRQVSVL